MALSPNYQWAEPDNSSLVKNGAQDIRALGDAVDTSVWNVGYGQAGKNKIINGDFSINQRSFSTVTVTTGTLDEYGFDRFRNFVIGNTGSVTISAQTFTPGTAPVAGYEATNFIRLQTSGQTDAGTLARIQQRIENVRTFAGQTMVVSFWAKAATGTPNIQLSLAQVFNSSADVVTSSTKQAITTSWARYSFIFNVPSISGKTLAAGNYLSVRINVSAGSTFNSTTDSLGIQSNTFDIWGVQAEYGSKATPFQTAGGGDPQSELAMCARYYKRFSPGGAYGQTSSSAYAYNTVLAVGNYAFGTTMRITPSSVDSSTLAFRNFGDTVYTLSAVTLDASKSTPDQAVIYGTVVAATAGHVGTICANNNTAAYIGFSAEL
jgi:hypothetical protein